MPSIHSLYSKIKTRSVRAASANAFLIRILGFSAALFLVIVGLSKASDHPAENIFPGTFAIYKSRTGIEPGTPGFKRLQVELTENSPDHSSGKIRVTQISHSQEVLLERWEIHHPTSSSAIRADWSLLTPDAGRRMIKDCVQLGGSPEALGISGQRMDSCRFSGTYQGKHSFVWIGAVPFGILKRSVVNESGSEIQEVLLESYGVSEEP